uniref:UDP-glucuronosyltransferase n=1 Tax=Megaselia scalaris TaxID=36166 RepID=T1GCU3_MEGSC
MAGNPAPYSITPHFFSSFTDNMNIIERAMNTGLQVFSNMMHRIVVRLVYNKIQKHMGSNAIHPYELSKNVSFILQNGHATVSYPRALNPNVAEVACIHCKEAGPLPRDLESFINSSENGFIYVSMGSSVKASNMPERLRKMLVKTFARLPYNVLWKWEDSQMNHDIPPNVMLSRWLPQQDILGHKKLRAFITHGGLLSMYETVFHGVPVVTMPVFCDHDVNSAKAEVDGYAIKLHLETLTTDQLYKAVLKVIHDPTYKAAARARQRLLRDQRSSPLETAVYWTEYVLRHNGAYHLQSTARNLSWMQYYLLDVALLYFIVSYSMFHLAKRILRHDVIELLHKKHKKL